MQTQPESPMNQTKRKQKSESDLTKAIYNMTLQNFNVMRRLLNNPTIERKTCVKIERLLDYLDAEKWAKLNDAERAEIKKEAQNAKETLRLTREARPLMQ